jgi:hypothetical protein
MKVDIEIPASFKKLIAEMAANIIEIKKQLASKHVIQVSPLVDETAFISIKQAAIKKGKSLRQIKNYLNDYKEEIRRLRSGRENLLHEIDLMEAMRLGPKRRFTKWD